MGIYKYQSKLSMIRKCGRNIVRQIKSNQIEIDYIKSSTKMNLQRIFHELKVSLADLQSKALHANDSKIKKQLTQFKRMQNLQLESHMESMQQSMQSAVLLSTRNVQNKENEQNSDNNLDIDQLQDEVDIVKKSLDDAKRALSPKKIKFNKISLTSSLDSSILSKRASVRKPSSFLNESCDTGTIRRLRNDLSSLECNYKYSTAQAQRSKKQKKKRRSIW